MGRDLSGHPVATPQARVARAAREGAAARRLACAPMKRFVLALDQGTTSSRAILFDHAANPVASAQRAVTQHFPHSGWVEHDAEEIWGCQTPLIAEVLAAAGASADELAAIGITNQRETTVLWDRRTGAPVARAIVWQDRRTAELC